jgi:hypothetical protein
MNERFRELAEQAGLKFDRYRMYVPSTLTVQETVNLQKFAELIVRESLNTMENCEGDLDFAIWKTKKDFGIEE